MSGEPSRHTRAPIGQSALSLLFAALVGAVTYFHFSGGLFCSSEQVHGANIVHALGVAFVAGLGGSVLVLCVRNRRRLLAAVLVLGSVALGVAITLVALDSATYTAHRNCGLFTDTETALYERVYYLYVLWGVPLALLLRSTVRALRRTRDEVERTPSGPATSSPQAQEAAAIAAPPLTEAERTAALDAAHRVRPRGP
jgi:glucan phosphoethanolaminetransferase (alkaline phosphatase superfamily)